jgi:DNA primase
VSMPLCWDEVVDDLDPRRFTTLAALERVAALRSDPWAGLHE